MIKMSDFVWRGFFYNIYLYGASDLCARALLGEENFPALFCYMEGIFHFVYASRVTVFIMEKALLV